MGLGLGQGKMLVKMYGGRIWVDSELGQGDTFPPTLAVAEGTTEETL
jgi:signal transduction histidine kinase